MSNDIQKLINTIDPLDSWPMSISKSLDLRGDSISSQKDEKQPDMVETPYFDKFDSQCDPDLFKNQLEIQNSISIRPSQLGQEWSFQPKFESSISNKVSTQQPFEQFTQKREKNELQISIFQPEVLHPTMQRPIVKKEQSIKNYSVSIKEIKRILNPLKRPLDDTERQFQIQEKQDIQIGASDQCHYIINDKAKSISKKHAMLKFEEEKDEWSLLDLNSTNGSYIIKEEIKLETNMELIIGTFICKVQEIKSLNDKTKSVNLLFTNLVDIIITPFPLQFNIQLNGDCYQIGKKSLKELKEDPIIEDLHCSLKMNSNLDIILINESTIYDQVGIKMVSNTPYKLKNELIIKFGFFNKYKFSITKTDTVEATLDTLNTCKLCNQTKQLYYVQPCNHKSLCLECILNKSQDICPSCKKIFIDFSLSISN